VGARWDRMNRGKAECPYSPRSDGETGHAALLLGRVSGEVSVGKALELSRQTRLWSGYFRNRGQLLLQFAHLGPQFLNLTERALLVLIQTGVFPPQRASRA